MEKLLKLKFIEQIFNFFILVKINLYVKSMDLYIIIGLIITIILLCGGIFLSLFFYKNNNNSKSQLVKDQLFLWFNGDLLVKIGFIWATILILDSVSKFELKLHKITHPL
jgi:hypothetical protein